MKFPAGKYYVGDLCYVIKDWDAFIGITDCGDGTFEWKGKPVWTHGTSFGDGTFLDNDGLEYPVDSGTIGILPIELIDDEEYGDDLGLGQIHTFTVPFTCEYEDGTFFIGPELAIFTDPQWDNEEE